MGIKCTKINTDAHSLSKCNSIPNKRLEKTFQVESFLMWIIVCLIPVHVIIAKNRRKSQNKREDP